MEGWENECKLAAHGAPQCCSAAVHDHDCATWLIRTFRTQLKILIGIMFPWISFNLTRCIDLQGLLSMKWVLKLLRLCLVHFCDLNTKYRGWARDGVQFGRCSESFLEHWISHTFCHFCSLLLEKLTKWKLNIWKSVCAILWVKTKGEREVSFELATKTFVA